MLACPSYGSVSIMIKDLSAPGFSGSVLAEKLAPFRPETKVLYASGYNDGSVMSPRTALRIPRETLHPG
jgi:hypothetical protein